MLLPLLLLLFQELLLREDKRSIKTPHYQTEKGPPAPAKKAHT